MKQTTLKDPQVYQAMGNVTLYMVDFDVHRDLAHQYQVSLIPSIILLNRFGEEVRRSVGYSQSNDFISFIHESNAAWHSDHNKAEQYQLEKLKWLEKLQFSPREHDRALMILMEDLKKGKHDREDILFSFWKTNYKALLQTLQHQQLFYRTVASRYLIKYLNDKTYDPWKSKDERAKAIQQLSDKLGK